MTIRIKGGYYSSMLKDNYKKKYIYIFNDLFFKTRKKKKRKKF